MKIQNISVTMIYACVIQKKRYIHFQVYTLLIRKRKNMILKLNLNTYLQFGSVFTYIDREYIIYQYVAHILKNNLNYYFFKSNVLLIRKNGLYYC